MNEKPFGLLELGSNSLKFYRVTRAPQEDYTIETRKIPWRIAHEFFTQRALREEAVEEIIAAFRQVEAIAADLRLPGMLSLATGVFREFPDIGALARRIKQQVGVRLRVISGKDEAKLMARSFRTTKKGSVVLGDLGGATTEWAWIQDGDARAWGSFRLGAIRNRYLVKELEGDPTAYLEKSRELCDDELRTLPVHVKSDLLVTGGTAKALASVRGSADISLEDLKATIDDVLTNGAPENLKPERREVLLPGLIILERLMVSCQAPRLKYSRTSVREGMASKLVDLVGERGRKDLHSTLLLYTRGT